MVLQDGGGKECAEKAEKVSSKVCVRTHQREACTWIRRHSSLWWKVVWAGLHVLAVVSGRKLLVKLCSVVSSEEF